MRSLWSVAYAFDVLAVIACVPLFVVALVGGLGLASFAILGAGVFWAVMARYDRRRAGAAERHLALRQRRLERMRAGTWSGPRRED
jgi:hypothetical protein